jgi:Protein of unknown function (DUF3352)
MRPAQGLRRRSCRVKCAAIAAGLLVISPFAFAQTRPEPSQATAEQLRALTKNPALAAEFQKLLGRFMHEIQFPPPRSESRILPLLPQSTTAYAALANYGSVANQALTIFNQELQQNEALRTWWQSVEPPSGGPKIEESVARFYKLSEYLGPELVVSGTIEAPAPKLVVLAEIRKPGLKETLQQMLAELPPSSSFHVRILSPKELAAAPQSGGGGELLLLVRPDFVAGASDLESLRRLNAALDRGDRSFASSPFGERIAQAYSGGATTVSAADLQALIRQIPNPAPQGKLALERSGFSDVEYLVWKHSTEGDHGTSSGELSFTGPRRGLASWLAAPAPMGSLDFSSPKAVFVTSIHLKNPAEMFDDLKDMATVSNPNAFATLGAFEQMLGVNLRDDVLGRLGGELTIELDGLTPPKPQWRILLSVKDAAPLQQALEKLLTAGHVSAVPSDHGDITYYTVRIPSQKTPTEISYAFVPGYLIVASSTEVIDQALLVNRTATSLAKSPEFLAALPPGHPEGISALVYENPVAMAALRLQPAEPNLAASLSSFAGTVKPVVACAYGDTTAIRGESTSIAMDAGAVMIAAAIAIPNLLRSRIAANEASAVGTMRTVVTAQVAYASTYPQRGYAPDLATLGPNPSGPSHTADHAALLDGSVANPTCAAGAWCAKAGFRFTVTGACEGQKCGGFVVVGTPIDPNAGRRSFCSVSDGVIRFKFGPPLVLPPSASDCRSWQPVE